MPDGSRMGDDIISRLANWGRWSRINPDGPDSSCQNSFWSQIVSTEDDGYGEIGEETIVVPQAFQTVELEEIDEPDAEVMDGWITQLRGRNRTSAVILICRFSLRHRVAWQTLDPAIRHLEDLMAENRLTVAEMRMRGMA